MSTSKYEADPLTGIKIVYDRRIKRGTLRADNSGRFLRMHPDTKPSLDRGIAYTNAKNTGLFQRMEFKGYMSPHIALNPPIVINPSFVTAGETPDA